MPSPRQEVNKNNVSFKCEYEHVQSIIIIIIFAVKFGKMLLCFALRVVKLHMLQLFYFLLSDKVYAIINLIAF